MVDGPARSPGDRGGDPADGTVRAQFDWASVSPSMAVIETVSVATDREPTDVPSLYEFVDTDALDSLVEGGADVSDDTVVSFRFAGRRVTVRSSGEVVVGPRSSPE